jgi:outer membrane protein
MKKISVIGFSIALTLAAAAAPSVFAADLVDVYREARAQDAQYASAKAVYLAGVEKLPQGRAGLLPLVNLSGDITRVKTEPQGFPSSTFTTRGYTLTLTQPLFRLQNLATYEQAKQQVVQAEAQFATAEQDLISRVAQAYFDVLLAQDNVELSGAQKMAIAEQLAQAKRNFEVGTATITDTNDAQARYDLAVAQEIADQNNLEVRKQALKQLINRLPDRLATLRETVDFPGPKPNNMEAWVGAATEKSYSIIAQQAGYEIATQQVRFARAGHLPTLDLVGSYNDQRNGTSLGLSERIDLKTQQIGVQLNVPLYAGGSVNSRVREAIALQEKANQDLESTKRTVAFNTRQAYLGVTNGIAQVKAREQSLISTQTSLDSTKLGREVGVRTGVDVLNSQQQLFQARRDLFQARYNVILGELQLKAAAGQLSEPDLEEINRLLAR